MEDDESKPPARRRTDHLQTPEVRARAAASLRRTIERRKPTTRDYARRAAKRTGAMSRLGLRRREFGVGQAEFADHVQISRSIYGQIERGERWIRPEQAIDIAHALCCDPGDVCRWVAQAMRLSGTLRGPRCTKLVPLTLPGEEITPGTKAKVPRFKPLTLATIHDPLERIEE